MPPRGPLVRALLLGAVAALTLAKVAPFALAQDEWTAPLEGVQRLSRDPLTQIPATPAPATIREGFTFAAVGDLLGPGRPVSPLRDPQFEQVATLIRSADVALGNGEGNNFDLATFKGYAAAVNGGGNRVDPPSVAHDYKEMGFDILSKANNHAVDWGLEGLAASEASFAQAGLLTAGSGRNRAAARAPVFMETPKGRVAVVAAASTFVPWAMAGAAEGEVPDRPGISVLRTRKIALVTPEDFQALKTLAARQPGQRAVRSHSGGAPEVSLYGQAYRAAASPGVTYEMNDLDQYEILKSVRGAKQQSDFTTFIIHAHENAGTGDDSVPADFLPVLFHRVVDAGADMVVGTGSHGLRGIEIYRGKPIFYGLASFFFQMEMGKAPYRDGFESIAVDPAPLTYVDYIHLTRFNLPREWFESVVAVTEFGPNGGCKEIRLYPLDLGYEGRTLNMRGTPRLAAPPLARTILERLQKYSARYGTQIAIEKGIGVIRPTATQQGAGGR